MPEKNSSRRLKNKLKTQKSALTKICNKAIQAKHISQTKHEANILNLQRARMSSHSSSDKFSLFFKSKKAQSYKRCCEETELLKRNLVSAKQMDFPPRQLVDWTRLRFFLFLSFSSALGQCSVVDFSSNAPNILGEKKQLKEMHYCDCCQRVWQKNLLYMDQLMAKSLKMIIILLQLFDLIDLKF